MMDDIFNTIQQKLGEIEKKEKVRILHEWSREAALGALLPRTVIMM